MLPRIVIRPPPNHRLFPTIARHSFQDHAVVMARFASDCLERAHVLTRELEVDLGPGTGDLTIRVSMNYHSSSAA